LNIEEVLRGPSSSTCSLVFLDVELIVLVWRWIVGRWIFEAGVELVDDSLVFIEYIVILM